MNPDKCRKVKLGADEGIKAMYKIIINNIDLFLNVKDFVVGTSSTVELIYCP